MPDDPATEARNTVLQVVTAIRGGKQNDMVLAASIVDDYVTQTGSMYPLFISAVAIIETILLSIAQEIEVDPDKLLAGVCLGISVKDLQSNSPD